MRATYLTMGICIALIACGKEGSEAVAPPPPPGATTALETYALADKGDTLAEAAIVNPCDPNGEANACDGGIDNTYDATRFVSELNKDIFVAGTETIRREECFGNSGPDCDTVTVQPYVNKHLKRFHFKKLRNNRMFILGAIEFPAGNAYNDYTYHFGKGLSGDPMYRRVYFVASGHTATNRAKPGLVVADWSAVILTNGQGTPALKRLRYADQYIAGRVVMCFKDHDDLKEGPEGKFRSCPADKALRELAAGAPLSRNGADSLVRDFASNAYWFKPADGVKALFDKTLPAASLGQRAVVGATLELLSFSELTDPYWFSCASGCCTADGY